MKTKIQWTDYSWNPITGCSKISPGCLYCYAEARAKRFAGTAGYPEGKHYFDVTYHPDRVKQPLSWIKGKKIFVCAMGDLFHEKVENSWLNDIFKIMSSSPWHTYLILTKRPERMVEYVNSLNRIPRNLWFGVTTESQKEANTRIPVLLELNTSNIFVSAEPLLHQINFERIDTAGGTFNALGEGTTGIVKNYVKWVIAGGESGVKARPSSPDWYAFIQYQCRKNRTDFFFKSWGTWIDIRNLDEDLIEKHQVFSFDDQNTVVKFSGDMPKFVKEILFGKKQQQFPRFNQ